MRATPQHRVFIQTGLLTWWHTSLVCFCLTITWKPTAEHNTSLCSPTGLVDIRCMLIICIWVQAKFRNKILKVTCLFRALVGFEICFRFLSLRLTRDVYIRNLRVKSVSYRGIGLQRWTILHPYSVKMRITYIFFCILLWFYIPLNKI